MWQRRAFFGARSHELLSALLGLTFRGTRGLMVDSTAKEEDSSDGSWRRIIGFRPLGDSLGSFLGGRLMSARSLLIVRGFPAGRWH
jgi:hypothetical protein